MTEARAVSCRADDIFGFIAMCLVRRLASDDRVRIPRLTSAREICARVHAPFRTEIR